ncbi:hypothetical protein [Vibrio mangrovi]|uniref:HEAT repeat domain-containing protein n=1 Tax=Vibrio mangrovi TaxID=474394 RepID=A0A1Y6J0B0_9VIBR|nr:hypothetical protein [Vibrio mangrovi]MDW6001942.1 hypothetical protein [Vibrio mangrovi]SMS02510.1 hypothetical protein VIM7927_03843 [Vibrio mangrovi]
MNTEDALYFLSQNQPMPPDDLLSQELIDKYDEIRKYFIKKPDDRSIDLFLRSYGEGDGWGVYQLVEDLLYQFPHDIVVKKIKNVLEDTNIPNSVRYWVTQVAAAFNDKILIDGLNISLSSDDVDIKEAAEIAINMMSE